MADRQFAESSAGGEAETPQSAAHDLAEMLASLQVNRCPGVFSVVSIDEATGATSDLDVLEAAAIATIREVEGRTFVVPVKVAREVGVSSMFDGAWLTLSVWSALDSVGLTAAVSTLLAADGIACNVFAGAYHDHLLVPVDLADRAISLLQRRS